jgi:hypothetical protein
LDESESDLEDSPFIGHGSGASTPRPTTTDDPPQNDDHTGGEHSYESDGSDSLGNDPMSSYVGTPRKPGGRPARRSTRKPASTVVLKQVLKSTASVNKRPTLFSLDSLLKEKQRKASDGYDLKAARNKLVLEEKVILRVGPRDRLCSRYGFTSSYLVALNSLILHLISLPR